MNTRITSTIFITGVSLLTISCGENSNNKFANIPPGVKDYAVLTLTPQKANINFDFPATIQGQQIIEIRPKIDGYMDAIYVKEGAYVKKGQLLFRISNPLYEQEEINAKASIKSALADVNAAKMNVEKVKPLVEKDIVSKYQLESAQYTLEAKEASLAQAKATLSNAQTNLGYTILKSPQEGVIGNIPYKIGALVNSSTTSPLTTLSDIENVYAYYSLNEKQLLQFDAGTPGATMQDKLKLLPPALLILADGTQYSKTGRVETASGLIATETGTASFKASFPNPTGIIRSGASATVRIPRSFDSCLLIPQSATYELQDKRFVYIVLKDHKIMGVPIKVIPTDNGQLFIATEGVKAGDKIVLEGLIGLKDSLLIEPREVRADSIYNKVQ